MASPSTALGGFLCPTYPPPLYRRRTKRKETTKKETIKETLPPWPSHPMPPTKPWSFSEEEAGRGGVACLMHLLSRDSICPLDHFRNNRYDEKYLVSLRNSGLCRVWDLTSSTVIANLAREPGEIFSSCRFSRGTDVSHVLFITAMHDDQAKIITWNTSSWKRIGSKRVVKDAISAFNVSPDGKLLAVGTTGGGIVMLNSRNLQVHSVIKKAHLGILTSLVFSLDSRALLSSSLDSTARVTTTEVKKCNGLSLWLVFLVVIAAMLVYYMKSNGLF